MKRNVGEKVQNLTLRTPTKQDVFEEYILWFALPPIGKIKMGIETKTRFCEFYNVKSTSLWRWEDRPDFIARVKELRKKWAFGKTSDVIYGIYKSAVSGNDKSQKLWMQVFEDFQEKQEVRHTVSVEVSVNDIRFLIEGLPEPLKTKHYDNLTELLIDCEQARRDGNFTDATTNIADLRPEKSISQQAYNDAQDISVVERTYEFSKAHSESVCTDLEWKVSSSNHKSAAWRG